MGSIWSKNGYCVIPITQAHIERALERDSSHCAIATAIADAIPDATFVCVDLQCIRFSRRGLRYIFLTPNRARQTIIDFDQGNRAALEPFELRMRPAVVAKAGKKRTHTPSNTELRGTGLTVSPVQLHVPEPKRRVMSCLNEQSKHQLQRELEQAVRNTAAMQNGKAPQRYTADGERNLDPDRSDGPPRVARALISTAAKGSIPTTLGGKLPPVSVLARREFGLRVLRR